MRGQCVQNAVKRSEALERKKQDWLDCGQNRNKGIRHAWRDRPSTIRGQLLLWPHSSPLILFSGSGQRDEHLEAYALSTGAQRPRAAK